MTKLKTIIASGVVAVMLAGCATTTGTTNGTSTGSNASKGALIGGALGAAIGGANRIQYGQTSKRSS